MANTIQIVGVEQAVANLAQLPRKVALKHLRIALNAAGGTIRNAAKALAPKQTGLLKGSLKVKVKIPDASWDIKHHGKPAYAVIGPARGVTKAVTKFIRITKRGKRRERFAIITKSTKLGGANFAGLRRASRYAHLAERHQPYIGPASKSAGQAATQRAAQKLAAAFETEAAALPK